MADEKIELSSASLAALREFLDERKDQETAHKREAQADSVTLVTSEDWQLSQFWYDAETCRTLAAEVIAESEDIRASGVDNVRIACISCPSTYKALLATGIPAYIDAMILEYDTRFGDAFGEAFGFYDYNQPQSFPERLRGAVDIIVIDPPFLNPECLGAFAATVAAMGKPNRPPRVMLCTGAVMLPHAALLLSLRPVRASIRHEGGRLSNPFSLYVSADYGAAAERLGGWDLEAEAAAHPMPTTQ